MQHQYVCVGGTFDGIHVGHEALLHKAFAVGQRVLIGLTSDAYATSYKRHAVRPYKMRVTDLRSWLGQHGYGRDRFSIVAIDDPYEPAASDPSLEAIVVSAESEDKGTQLNRMRAKRGLPALDLLVVGMVEAVDHQPVSSSRVRNGDIDRTGTLLLPDALRDELSHPLGRVIREQEIPASLDAHKEARIISVGDRTTKALLESGITPCLMIIDNKVNRVPFAGLMPILAHKRFATVSVVSGPGCISQEAIQRIQRYVGETHTPRVIDVTGEEDLLALPAIALAPVGSVVYYGQPEQGVVEVIVTEEKKQEARNLLSRFTT